MALVVEKEIPMSLRFVHFGFRTGNQSWQNKVMTESRSSTGDCPAWEERGSIATTTHYSTQTVILTIADDQLETMNELSLSDAVTVFTIFGTVTVSA